MAAGGGVRVTRGALVVVVAVADVTLALDLYDREKNRPRCKSCERKGFTFSG